MSTGTSVREYTSLADALADFGQLPYGVSAADVVAYDSSTPPPTVIVRREMTDPGTETGGIEIAQGSVILSKGCKPNPPTPPTGTPTAGKCYMLVECGTSTLPPSPPSPPKPPKPSGPNPAPPPPPPTKWAGAVGWDNPNICDDIRGDIEGRPDNDLPSDEFLRAITELEQKAADTAEASPSLFAWVPRIVEAFWGAAGSVYEKAYAWVDDLLEGSAFLPPDETSIVLGCAATLGMAGWVQAVTRIPTDYLSMSVRYKMQWAAPQLLPQQSGLDLLYLTSRINDEQWECWTRALGNLPMSHRRIRDAQEARLAIPEIIELFMRKAIDKEQVYEELRKRGVIDRENADRWLRLRQSLPTETDLIPFMTRDVESDKVDWTKSDEWFAENYKGDTARWGEMLGIDPKVMQMRARAHWQLPSNTALYAMMARLRPGRRDDGLEVSYDDAKQLLRQNDMEPSWLDKVLAISYLPPTRTDIKMGIKTRTIATMDEAIELLLDAQIDPEFAPTLARILWDDANRQVANESNTWSRAKILAAYRKGEIDQPRARELLGRFMVSSDQIDELLRDNDEVAAIEVRRECIKAVKNRVLRAEVTELEASQQLVALGMTEDKASQIAQGFVCYRASRGTELTLRYLAKIWKQGILPPEELYIRFLNLRYTEQDALLLLRSWQIELSEDRRKEALREQKARETEIRSMRSRYRTEVAWYQKQLDRLKKQQKADPPAGIDAVDTDGRYIPGNPEPPIP